MPFKIVFLAFVAFSASAQTKLGLVSQAEIYYASPGQVNRAAGRPGDGQCRGHDIDCGRASGEHRHSLRWRLRFYGAGGIPAGYAVEVGPNNAQTIVPIFTQPGGIFSPVPIDVSSGDVYLTLFGTGFDNASFGAEVEIGNVDESASYVGPQGQFPGMDQINFLVPKSLAGRGSVPVLISFVTAEVNFNIAIK